MVDGWVAWVVRTLLIYASTYDFAVSRSYPFGLPAASNIGDSPQYKVGNKVLLAILCTAH